jgi:carbon-monoxide dehydrogenase medium subunit
MYATDFDYYRAGSLGEAHRLLQRHKGAKLLAGGHSLVPLLKLRLAAPPAVIDIGRVAELRGITIAGGMLRIGALTTHADIAASADVRRACAALADAAGMIGDAQVRNWGTIGGNVAHADPGSDLPTVLTAVGARFLVSGPTGQRALGANELFVGLLTTSLGDDDILTAVEVPAAERGSGSAYVKFPHPASRYAVVGVAARVSMKGKSCESATVAVGGLVPTPTRAPGVEAALAGQALSDDRLTEAAGRVADDLGDDLLGDLFASAEYRRAMAPVYVARALGGARDSAGS